MKPLRFLAPLAILSGTATAASVITAGHVDFPGFGYEGGEFEPHSHAEAGAIVDGAELLEDTEYEPGELIVAIPQTSTVTVDSTTYYWLPEGFVSGVPFVGIGLEELTFSDWVGGTVTITLLSYSGPGDFLLWQDDGFGGENIFLDTANNIDSFQLVPGSHNHFNWGFTDNAFHSLEFEISGTHVTDGAKSGSATYSFMVPEPSSALLGALGFVALLRRRR